MSTVITRVSITKKGFRVTRWNKNKGRYAPVKADTLVPYLRSVCSIRPGVTLEELFEAVERDSPLKEFLRQYSWCSVDDFHAEAPRRLRGKRFLPEVDYIEISKSVEFDSDGAEKIVKVSGVGKAGAQYPRYGIELTSVRELARLVVKLNPVATVRRDNTVVATATASFSLLDVLGEIYWEISFYGNPRQQAAFVESLRSINSKRNIRSAARPRRTGSRRS